MRQICSPRRLAATTLIGVVLAVQGPLASAVTPAADEPEPVVTDTALYAEPSSTATTLTRGGSGVTVSKTAGLTRQMLTVSWSGMTPSALAGQQYPVVVMQCRGNEPSREDCWSGGFYETNGPSGTADGLFRPDPYLPADDVPWSLSFTSPAFGRSVDIPFRNSGGAYRAQLKPNGLHWVVAGLADNPDGVPAVDDWTPAAANMRRGFTQSDGTGQAQTWVNTGFENPSLGCSETRACSLVVVPIKDRACRTVPHVTQTMFNWCNGAGKNAAKATSYWQLLGNWYERYVFKLSFTPRATTCAQRDDTAVLYGSELVAEAMRRWVPARCQQSSPVALDYTRGLEADGRRLVGQQDPIGASGFAADGALVTEPAAADEPAAARKPAYAPVAVSGFAIGYQWDKQAAGGGGPVTALKLNARLVAKWLTQSYPGGYRVGPHGLPVNPNAPTNPQNILQDPEFQQLNPGAEQWAGYNYSRSPIQLALPALKTDVLLALTRWLWSDPAARAYLQGKADPWGATVNKTYRGWPLPRDDYELKDGWLLPEGQGLDSGYSPQQLSAQMTGSFAEAADILMTAWPRSQVVALTDPPNPDFPTVLKRSPAQPFDLRHLAALSTTSELEKAGMRIASLQNSAGEFVAPSTESLHYALDGATVDRSGAWRINHAAMDRRGYPATMITYAMVPTATLKGASPKRYAETLRWIATEGQAYGLEAGVLPEGYLALTDPMRDQAVKVADAVEKQTGTPPKPPGDPLPEEEDPTPDDPKTPNPDDPNKPGDPDDRDPDDRTNPDSDGTGSGDTGSGPADNANSGDPAKPGGSGDTDQKKPGGDPSSQQTPGRPNGKQQAQSTDDTKPAAATTRGESLGWLAWGIPALLLGGLLAGVASPGVRVIAQPGHPVRRGLAAGASYLAGFVRRGRRSAR